MQHTVKQLAGIRCICRFDQICPQRVMGLCDFSGIESPQTPIVAEEHKFPCCEQLDQRSMAALDLLRTAYENAYFAGVLGANRNNGVPFAVVHAADDNPFHPV
ncbi:hypothetical protein D3C73_1207400 [compost metagenome]